MNRNDLCNTIIEFLRAYKAYEIKGICEKYGIKCDDSLDPMHSKRTYINTGLVSLNIEQLKEIAKNIIKEEQSQSFIKAVECYLDDDFFELKMTTRRILLDWLGSQMQLHGNMRSFYEVVSDIWDLKSKEIDCFDGEKCCLNDFLIQHMVRNDDIDNYECLEKYLDFMYIPDSLLFRFLERLVNPPVRFGENQLVYVSEINKIIGVDGYRLFSNKNISGRKIYKIESFSKTVIKGEIHNIIFAAYDKKPDIVIEDSLTNKLKINSDEEKCLFYDLPIGSQGLSWNDMVVWWNNGNEEYDISVEKELVERLKKSLDSEPEHIFLRTYYNFLYVKKNKNLPALIPQVYCHFDPKTAKMRGGQVYVLQRMDFLMLLPEGVRIIIEIDGKHHYSDENGNASPLEYSKMVSEDRKLKLYGYDVYRFGGFEFCDEEKAKQMIIIFINNLFKKYNINL